MENTWKAIETTGTVDEQRQLRLDDPLPIAGPQRVRVIVLYPLLNEGSEKEWQHAAAQNPVFHFLQDPAEDIYSSDDGQPFHDPA